jgi:type 1 glutamine amidotransferase
LGDLGRSNGFTVEASEDPAVFSAAALERFAAIVFLHASGDVLDEFQRAAFAEYLFEGGGFVGVHGAATAEPSSTFYGELIGVRFDGHPEIQPARLIVTDPDDSSVVGFLDQGLWFDEWYNFRGDPRSRGARILLEVDEGTYRGGTMGPGHPIAWRREIGAGRAWFTALGHAAAAYTDPTFRDHLLGGVRFVIGR